MAFALDEAVALLERTPAALDGLLRGLPDAWTRTPEGPGRWSPFDVVGHLIHGERTDWIPRARIIFEEGPSRPFEPFDRFAQLRENEGRTMAELLAAFAGARAESLAVLRGWRLTEADLGRRGTHPELGGVTLGELLATWVVHDCSHVRQVARVMAKRYTADVGPWRAYLPVLGE